MAGFVHIRPKFLECSFYSKQLFILH